MCFERHFDANYMKVKSCEAVCNYTVTVILTKIAETQHFDTSFHSIYVEIFLIVRVFDARIKL